jgi:hypothetical protein
VQVGQVAQLQGVLLETTLCFKQLLLLVVVVVVVLVFLRVLVEMVAQVVAVYQQAVWVEVEK